MTEMLSSPLFGITLSAVCFEIGIIINRRLPSPLTNPLLSGIIICISIIRLFGIPLDLYFIGGDIITALLPSVAAVLAVSIYSRIDVLKANFLPVFTGTLIGSVVSITSAYLLCRLFGLDDTITASLLPKSVTTSVATEISAHLGGNSGITVAAVIFSGILCSICAPFLLKLSASDDPIANGVAIGTSGHAMGTSLAVRLGDTEGAMSSISIGMAGIITVIITAFL